MLQQLLNLVAPPTCAFCGTPASQAEDAICNGCFADLPWSEAPASVPPKPLFMSIAMLDYAFPVDVAIKALKFQRRLWYGPAFAEILGRAAPLLPQDIDGVLPVPLHWFRQWRRGFNQSYEIARPLAKRLDLPIVKGVVRQRATPFQSGLDASQRAGNLRNAFVVRRALDSKHILVVDDVLTTGATATALARCLRRHGVPRVSVLVVARA